MSGHNSGGGSHSHSEPAVVHRKIATLGFRGVGKSCLTNCFVYGGTAVGGGGGSQSQQLLRLQPYDPTIESTRHKIVRFRKIHFATDIVDTAGMDEYSRLSRNASLGVHGYVLVFSITSRHSFERIVNINDMLLSTLGDVPDVPRVLVGSMSDLEGQRQVSQEDALKLAGSWSVPYVECSSLTGEHVADVFHTLLKEIEKDDGLLTETDKGGCVVL